MIWVLDASVALRWFLGGEENPHAEAVLERVLECPGCFAVPELFAFETFAVLCRAHPKPLEAFLRGVNPILSSGILRTPVTDELVQAAQAFVQRGLTGYDACYAALARLLNGTWLTFDEKAHRRIARADVSHCLKRGLPSTW